MLFKKWVDQIYPAILTDQKLQDDILGTSRALTKFEEKWIMIFMDDYVKITPWYTGWGNWISTEFWQPPKVLVSKN